MITVSNLQLIVMHFNQFNKHSVLFSYFNNFELKAKCHVIMFNWDNLKLVYINGNRLPCVNSSLKSLILTVTSHFY